MAGGLRWSVLAGTLAAVAFGEGLPTLLVDALVPTVLLRGLAPDLTPDLAADFTVALATLTLAQIEEKARCRSA